MGTVLSFILRAIVIGALYTGELFIITDLFMAHTRWHLKRVIGYGAALTILYACLIYKYGMSDDLWYVGLSAIIINNFLHEGKLRTRIWVFFAAYAVSVGGEGIVCILLDQLYTAAGYEGTSWILDDFVPHLSAFLMAAAVSSLFKKTPLYHKDIEAYNDFKKRKCVGIALIGIIYAVIFNTISIMYIYQENTQFGSAIIFGGVYFTLGLIAATTVYSQMRLKKEYAFREAGILNKAFTGHMDTYNHLEEIDRASEDIRAQIEREIEEVLQLAGEGESGRLLPYVEAIEKRLATSKSASIVTGNEAVNAMLHEKAVNAREKGIAFETNVSIPNVLKLNLVDLCIILDCTMDYVIKKCDQCKAEEKKIKVKGLWFKGYLMFEVWYTLEEEKGIGEALPEELTAAMKCLNKYDGEMSITKEEHLGKIKLNFNTMGGAPCSAYS